MRLLVRGLLLALDLLLAGALLPAGALLFAGAASPALAADIDNSWLRGSSSFPADPPTYRRWSGVYAGGQVGADVHSSQYADNGNAMVSSLLARDPILVFEGAPALSDLARRNITGLSYGGFFGYNYQIDDTVLGVELNFNGTGINAGMGSAAARTTTSVCPTPPLPGGGNTCQITVNASNAVTSTLNDYGTLRVRGGWAYGSFLPYVVVGVAVGWINSVQTVNVGYSGIITVGPNAGQNIGPQSYSDTVVNRARTAVGFSAGLGVDYAVYQNVFLRGEFEYLQFGAIGPINVNAMSVRTGLGMKF